MIYKKLEFLYYACFKIFLCYMEKNDIQANNRRQLQLAKIVDYFDITE